MVKSKHIGIFLFMMIFMFPLVSSLDTLGENFNPNDNITITQVCFDATYINITSIQYPNSSRISINEEMVKDGGDYVYYFADTSQLGRYDVRGISDGCTNTFAMYFYIGNQVSIPDSIFFILILIILVLTLFYSTKLIGYKSNATNKDLYDLKKENPLSYYLHIGVRKNLGIFGWFGAYLSLWMFFIILNIGVYYLNFVDLSSITSVIVVLLSWGLVPFSLFWIPWLLITIINSVKDVAKFEYGGMRQ